MERLTDKIYEKTNDVLNLMQNVSTKYGYIEYLSADLGTVKDRLEAVVGEVWEYIEKLNEYEDLEEQGKLRKLPCAPGQPVWKIKNGKIQKWVVGTIKIEESGVSFYNVVYICDISDFGKTVFFTREEAEAALKRMEV